MFFSCSYLCFHKNLKYFLTLKNEQITRAYLEASFQKTRVRTAAKEGISPQWNETLSLELTTPNGDLSPKSLLDADIGMDCLFLNLFDEVIVDMAEVCINFQKKVKV